jgi:hypothetical protein
VTQKRMLLSGSCGGRRARTSGRTGQERWRAPPTRPVVDLVPTLLHASCLTCPSLYTCD